MKKTVKMTAVIIAVLILVVLVRALLFTSKQVTAPKPGNVNPDVNLVARHLAGAIAFRTISAADESRIDRAAFLGLHRYLEQTYPRVHAVMKKEVVNRYSLLYTWRGADPSLKPLLLMSHLDVVPADKKDGSGWTHDPFAGIVADGYIWGRGALDVKNGLIGIMEAMEILAARNAAPARTIYLAFGHDEELGGKRGNLAMADLLRSRGVRFACVIDEGGYVVEGMVPGMEPPAALVGIAEKGNVSLELSSREPGGHSSMPPALSNIGRISRAICRLEEDPFPGGLAGPARDMFEYLGPEMSFGYRVLFGNVWLIRPVLEMVLSSMPSTGAMIRTTTAATIFKAGTVENVLPGEAAATVNFRILPGETPQTVMARVRDVLDDGKVTVTMLSGDQEPSPVSRIDGPEFKALQKSISAVMPGVVVAPYLVVGATDSRHYSGIADQVYRFLPGRLSAPDLNRIHGVDERIGVENMAEFPLFFIAFIEELNRNY